MKLVKLIVLSCWFFRIFSYAETNERMKKIYENMLKISDSIYEQRCDKVNNSFNVIDHNSKYLGKHFFLRNKGYKVSYKNFRRVFEELQGLCGNKKEKDYRYVRMLKDTVFKSCFHCHSTDRIKLENSVTRSSKAGIVEQIKEMIVSRNYTYAEIEIDKFFKNINYGKISDVLNLEQDLFLKIYNKPKKLLSRYKKRKELNEPYNLKQNIWVFELDNLPNIRKKDLLFKVSEKFVKGRIGLFVSDSERIKLKYILGRLSHLLHEVASKDRAKVLYYLGSLENRLDHSHYSVDNLYLLECLENHGKDKIAKRCFDEFLGQINFSFTGSKGTDIPDSVKKLIKELTPIVP